MNYGSSDYWDERYAAVGDRNEDQSYDWYVLSCVNQRFPCIVMPC